MADAGASKVSKHLPTIDETSTGGPVELEGARRIRDVATVEAEGLGSSFGSVELHKAVAGVTGRTVADDLDVNVFARDRGEDILDKILVHPRLEFAHPARVVSRRYMENWHDAANGKTM